MFPSLTVSAIDESISVHQCHFRLLRAVVWRWTSICILKRKTHVRSCRLVHNLSAGKYVYTTEDSLASCYTRRIAYWMWAFLMTGMCWLQKIRFWNCVFVNTGLAPNTDAIPKLFRQPCDRKKKFSLAYRKTIEVHGCHYSIRRKFGHLQTYGTTMKLLHFLNVM